MNLRIHPEASAELEAAVAWYDRVEPERDLGAALFAEVERGLIVIASAPDVWPLERSRSHIRRFLLSRFPYGILYELANDELCVYAICHTSRRPGYWKGRRFD